MVRVTQLVRAELGPNEALHPGPGAFPNISHERLQLRTRVASDLAVGSVLGHLSMTTMICKRPQKTNFNSKRQLSPQGYTFCVAGGGRGFTLTSSFLLSVCPQ